MNALAVPTSEHPALDLRIPLAAHGLHLAYGPREIRRGVDLELRQGEVLGLIGRNGRESVVNCPFTDEEQAAFEASHAHVRALLERAETQIA